MKKVIFENLKVKNFLSIGSEPVSLEFTPGINLITGVNLDKEDTSNGSGKSSLVNALYFCLYGKTLKELKVDQIPNMYTKGVCEVELSLKIMNDNEVDQYTIVRSLRPTKLKIYKNSQDVTKSTVAQTSELLSGIISCTNIVFEKSIVMDANSSTSFMSQKKVEKRKFLEGILNLGIFGEMFDNARTDLNNKKYNFDVYDVKLSEYTQTLKLYEQQSTEQEERFKEKRYELKDKLESVDKRIQELSSEINHNVQIKNLQELEDAVAKLTKLKEKSEKQLKANIAKSATLLQEKKHIIKSLDALAGKVDMCPECGQMLSEQEKNKKKQKTEELKAELEGIDDKANTLTEQDIETKDLQSKILTKINTLQKEIHSNKDAQAKQDNLNWRIQQLEQDKNEIKDELSLEFVNTYNDLINEQKLKVQESQDKVIELKQQIEVLQAVKFVLSQEGVKSYVVKKILKVLNSKLNTYLRKLETNIKCEFNEYFEETLWDQYGNERSYNNFSSGEQRRIDLSILFAFQDIRKFQADISMNISIYDELLDSSLDRKGAELVLFLLKERAAKNNECVYIVSHRKEVQLLNASKVITLYKKNGITYI